MKSQDIIHKKYIDSDQIKQEKGDFLLPHIVSLINTEQWIDPRPTYQRRLVWSDTDKSKFIESLLLNLPIPPIFLYEKSYNNWEIMDGQQRSQTLADFYSDEFALKGLKLWHELNGKKFSELPEIIIKGLNRRRIHSVTILAYSNLGNQFDMYDLRKEVFERLNTGGTPLNAQELRNCLHAGKFADLLDKLSSNKLFTTLWDIPEHKEPASMASIPPNLSNCKLFSRMGDCELVLRFFAFEKSKFFSGAVKRALDSSMSHYSRSDQNLSDLEIRFTKRLNFIFSIFGEKAFIPGGGMIPRVGRAKKIYDALMHGSKNYVNISIPQKKKTAIRNEFFKMLKDTVIYESMIQRHDNKAGFDARKSIVTELFDKHLE